MSDEDSLQMLLFEAREVLRRLSKVSTYYGQTVCCGHHAPPRHSKTCDTISMLKAIDREIGQ